MSCQLCMCERGCVCGRIKIHMCLCVFTFPREPYTTPSVHLSTHLCLWAVLFNTFACHSSRIVLNVLLQFHRLRPVCVCVCVCAYSSTENSIWQGQLCRKWSIEQQLHSAAKDSLLDSRLFYGALRKTAEPTHKQRHIAYVRAHTHVRRYTLVEQRIKEETESKSGGGVTNLLFLCLERLEEMSEGCKIILTGRIKTLTDTHMRAHAHTYIHTHKHMHRYTPLLTPRQTNISHWYIHIWRNTATSLAPTCACKLRFSLSRIYYYHFNTPTHMLTSSYANKYTNYQLHLAVTWISSVIVSDAAKFH